MTWVRIPPGAAHFFFERRESEPSQLVLLCCLILFDVSQLINHVRVYEYVYVYTCTQPKIIGLDSMPTAVRYRIEDKEELESST